MKQFWTVVLTKCLTWWETRLTSIHMIAYLNLAGCSGTMMPSTVLRIQLKILLSPAPPDSAFLKSNFEQNQQQWLAQLLTIRVVATTWSLLLSTPEILSLFKTLVPSSLVPMLLLASHHHHLHLISVASLNTRSLAKDGRNMQTTHEAWNKWTKYCHHNSGT